MHSRPRLNLQMWLLLALLLAGACAGNIAEEVAAEEAPAPPPSTDIHLVALGYEGDSIEFGTPENVTNRPGYDNQPWFIPGQDAFYFSGMGADTSTNIYRYDLAIGEMALQPSSPDAEYSPQNPMGNANAVTVVRVEADGTQRFWKYEGQSKTRLMQDNTTIGYYIWTGESNLLMLLVGDTLTLHTYDFATGTDEYVLDNPGRTFKRVPGSGLVSFVHKVSEEEWWVKTFDPASGAIEPLVRTLPGREDFAWLPDGRIIMSGESSLHIWSPGEAWQEAIKFDDPALQGITRLAVSADGRWLAIVSVEAVAE